VLEYIGGYLLICKDIFRYDRIYEGLWTTKKTDLSFGSTVWENRIGEILILLLSLSGQFIYEYIIYQHTKVSQYTLNNLC
jgi:hypothetical protein